MKFWNKKIEQKDTDFEYWKQVLKKSKNRIGCYSGGVWAWQVR